MYISGVCVALFMEVVFEVGVGGWVVGFVSTTQGSGMVLLIISGVFFFFLIKEVVFAVVDLSQQHQQK